MNWNCDGGMITQGTDENGKVIAVSYADAHFWRAATVTDEANNQTNFTYTGQIAAEAALQAFNAGQSTSDTRNTLDGFGRPLLAQTLQAPGASNYDTVETDYNAAGLPSRTTMPFAAAQGVTSSTAPGVTTTYDALGRVLTIVDANGGEVAYNYTNNDVMQTITGIQIFQKQFEFDGLGRLTSVCEVTNVAGSGACGQSVSATGFSTKYGYDALGRLLTVTQSAQAPQANQQMRVFKYDMLGRMTSESNPETGNGGTNGTISYTYDAVNPCGDGNNYSFPGDLVQKKDNAGNVTCFSYDSLHRVTQEGNSSIAGATIRNFFYDSKASYPSGVTIVNGKTELIEAQTVTASNSVVTDEYFSYSPRGELTDVFEFTPHSGGFYHTSASYWPIGTAQSISGIPGVPTISYGANGAGMDGEGRVTEVSASSGANPVTNVTYSSTVSANPLGVLTNVTFGSQDNDTFAYDPNTARMLAYSFNVNGNSDAGTLTWNTNGTLSKLIVNDHIPGTGDSQTCTFSYDNLQRLSQTNCGTQWTQNFTYDPMGNVTKNVPPGSGGISFLPTYSSAPPTNQFTAIPGVSVSYDNNGNLLTDNLNSYSWDPNWGNILTVSNGALLVQVIYDAFGRMVEQQNAATSTEILYSPIGKIALMNGRTLLKAFIPLPGGSTAIYNSTGLAYYRHSDWLGSSRLTTTQLRGLYFSTAYAPFGEQYGNTGGPDPSYTGQNSDSSPNLYDFMFREMSPTQGRWISPDPLGVQAADPNDPQSWNRYAYAMNDPLNFIDALGLLITCDVQSYHVSSGSTFYVGIFEHCDDSGGGGGDAGGDRGGGGPHGGANKDATTCRQIAAGQVPKKPSSTWWSSYVDASYMFDRWLVGTGPTQYHFGPNSPESQEMMSAYGLAQNVGNFLSGGPSSGNQSFGARGYVSSGLNPTAQFVGSYQWSMSRTGGNLSITLTNTTTAWSFFLHARGLNPNPPRRFDSVLNPGWHPMGRVDQTFQIQVPCP